MKKTSSGLSKIFIVLLMIFLCSAIVNVFTSPKLGDEKIINNVLNNPDTLYVLSSYENKNVEDEVIKYAKSIGKNLKFEYKGDLEIVEELNSNSSKYDAVWISNSMWLYMLDNPYLTTDSKSISISPVVLGVKMSKAKELGLVNNSNVSNNTILNLIKERKIKYVMSSVTQTNTGATAYLGFLSSLAGNPEVLTEEMLNNEELKSSLISLFSGVERVSGDDDFLQQMFLKSKDYEAVIAAESSLIDINKKLVKNKKEPLYLIYPTDGVAVNDSVFAFINNDSQKENLFLDIQSYLLSEKGQKMLEKNGVRTWYGGVNSNPNSEVFNKDWGIDTTKYLNVTKFPSKKVITSAINLYIERLRKPTHVVFCLDYSGSMYGEGVEQLKKAMNYILSYDEAKKDKLQFSKSDKITVITFDSKVSNIWTTENGLDTDSLKENINKTRTGGATALYAAIEKGLDELEKDDDSYTKTIIAMTDGFINIGNIVELRRTYKSKNSNVPIYSIMFGSASESQLNDIAKLSNAKVFDGKTDLLKAFKEVRGYN